MRSTPSSPDHSASEDDRTTRARIRDEALRLVAAHGPDAVSVRRIAAAADVSPGLVLHHFGSKDGLREELDRHVLERCDALLGELTGERPPGAEGSLAEALAGHFPPESPLPGYLRRMLTSDGDAGRQLFRRLYEVSRDRLDGMVAAGTASPGQDPAVRAAFLLVNDLAVVLLRERLTEALGVDPLTAEGTDRWAPEVMAVYAAGIGARTGGPK
ncbi:TetR/AcrR family transcriptional regulator [Streptomyces sp. NPDC017529]|uniref:TetR/AcrR family transcriptional regulator n=1 Tax=Streptomyces sp. NPDC017529 TaxID=3365000 RepID=UPI0037A5D67F